MRLRGNEPTDWFGQLAWAQSVQNTPLSPRPSTHVAVEAASYRGGAMTPPAHVSLNGHA